MVHVKVSTTIRAPQPHVVAVYRNYSNWPQLFPLTIRGVRLLCEQPGTSDTPGTAVLLIEHTEGPVINVLTYRSPQVIELEEFKRRYDATFLNRFTPAAGGTRFTLEADIRLKGIYRLLAPFLARYVRRQMIRYVLEPVKTYAEETSHA